ncbi:MAG: DNA mismatch repair protein [Icmadophila ericetorum]|nr:DNA mismatch repair protein [Icmadophila ericetorum]
MLRATAPIRPLPPDVAAQIKSSIAITSLSNAVLGLAFNSLDARAKHVEIMVDFRLGTCCVEDDGFGIPTNEFEESGGLGKIHHTSKYDESNKIHGSTGTFLSSLAAVSILTISSHHRGDLSNNTLILHHSRPAARLVPASFHHHTKFRDHGTKITVQDLFGNMPVRVKQRALAENLPSSRQKEWELLRWNIIGVLLAWDYPISLTIKGADISQRIQIRSPSNSGIEELIAGHSMEDNSSFDTALLRNYLIQGARIGHSSWSSWKTTSAQTSSVTIRAIISLQPSPIKNYQFISIGVHHLSREAGHNILYDEINRLFTFSSFGCLEDTGIVSASVGSESKKDRRNGTGFTNKQLKGGGKGVDRWPMFYIRIETHRSKRIQALQFGSSLEDSSTLSTILNVLGIMMINFLKEYHLRPKARPASKRVCSKDSVSQPKLPFVSTPSSSQANGRNKSDTQSAKPHNTELSSISKVLRPSSLSIHDFGGNVKFPSFARDKVTIGREEFCGWSRIKSGMSTNKSKFGPVAGLGDNEGQTPATEDLTSFDEFETDDDAEAWLEAEKSVLRESDNISSMISETTQSHGIGCNNVTHQNQQVHDVQLCQQTHNKASHGDHHVIHDTLLPWTNPVTKATVYINARTGLVAHDNRPTTPASSDPNSFSNDRSSRPSTALSGWLKSARRNSETPSNPKAGSWAEKFLNSWENPVFPTTEDAVAQAQIEVPDFGDGETTISKQYGNPYREVENTYFLSSSKVSANLSRGRLKEATVLAQVDTKFILVKMAAADSSDFSLASFSNDKNALDPSFLLVLVDQHAADERIRIESLLSDLCSPSTTTFKSGLNLTSSISTTVLQKPIRFQIPTNELPLFHRHAPTFAKWGILYDLTRPAFRSSLVKSQTDCFVVVQALPGGIAERCRLNVHILKDLMRREVYRREEEGTGAGTIPSSSTNTVAGGDLLTPPSTTETTNATEQTETSSSSDSDPIWLTSIRDCPPGMIDLLNSRSCRSAIMFNDVLTLEECETLVRRLAECKFPFMCAHGRPSMVPLVALEAKVQAGEGWSGFGIGGGAAEGLLRGDGERDEVDFGEAWGKWMGRGEGEEDRPRTPEQ